MNTSMNMTMNMTMNEIDTQIDDLKKMMQSDQILPNPVFSRLSADATPFTPSYDSGILTPVPSVSTNSPIVEPSFQAESEDDVVKPPVEAVLSNETEETEETYDSEDNQNIVSTDSNMESNTDSKLVSNMDSELLSFLFLLSLFAVALRIASISPEYRHIRSAVSSLVQEARTAWPIIQPNLERFSTVFKTIVCR